jgi:hypothetical protein
MTGLAVGFGAAAVAALQLILSRWRDLGPSTAGGMSAALLLVAGDVGPVPVGAGPGPWIGLALAAGLATAAAARGARAGVGHPEWLAAVATTGLGARGALEVWPGEPALAAGAGVVLAVAAVGQGVALRRRSSRRPGVRWVGEIRVDGGAR